MKKTYSKPEIMFEGFAMSTNIAAGCETTSSLPSYNVCGYPTRGGNVFTSEIGGANGCTVTNVTEPYSTGNNTFCYHVPDDWHNIFNS